MFALYFYMVVSTMEEQIENQFSLKSMTKKANLQEDVEMVILEKLNQKYKVSGNIKEVLENK